MPFQFTLVTAMASAGRLGLGVPKVHWYDDDVIAWSLEPKAASQDHCLKCCLQPSQGDGLAGAVLGRSVRLVRPQIQPQNNLDARQAAD